MASEMIKWMANKLSDQLKGDSRKNFLDALKHNQEFVVKVFAQDVERLAMNYTMETKKTIGWHCAKEDPNCFETCAKAIKDYMHDEMLVEELATIE